MKEIIPLKKELMFKSKVYEVTNISVEHDYKIEDNILNGNLFINGTYVMTEASVIEEEFDFTIPFSIVLSDNIDRNTVNVEIDDFKYEVNKDALKINSELLLTCDKIEKVEEVKEENKEEIIDNLKEQLDNYFIENESDNNMKEESINKLTNEIISNEEVYSTYKIYIIKESDTIDTICNKYGVTKELLSEYNDITNINIGDKIIIPDNEV